MTAKKPLTGERRYVRVKAHYKKKPRSGLVGSLIDSLIGEKKVLIRGYTRKVDQRGTD
ncbi:MAG: hypothetical protein WBA22_04345 [Candidatus Methanofastidiosia archaeon]